MLKAAKLRHGKKRKDSISSLKPGSRSFGVLLSVLKEGKSVILPLFNDLEMLSFASDKSVLQLIKPFYEL